MIIHHIIVIVIGSKNGIYDCHSLCALWETITVTVYIKSMQLFGLQSQKTQLLTLNVCLLALRDCRPIVTLHSLYCQYSPKTKTIFFIDLKTSLHFKTQPHKDNQAAVTAYF